MSLSLSVTWNTHRFYFTDLHLRHSTQISITTNIHRVWRLRSIINGTLRHKTIQTFTWIITCKITKETSMGLAPAAVEKRKGNTRSGSTKLHAKSSRVRSKWVLLVTVAINKLSQFQLNFTTVSIPLKKKTFSAIKWLSPRVKMKEFIHLDETEIVITSK